MLHIVRWPQQALIGLVLGYRLLLKAWIGNSCRFEPSCSAYALQALRQHGAVRGAALTGWRLLRCHPWCDGGCDPVPENPAPLRPLFTGLLAGPTTKATDIGGPSRNDQP